MKLTEKQEKDVIDIFSNPNLSKKVKLTFLRFIMNNNLEILIAKIEERRRLED
ncbi:hypothetical protein LCGC14_3156130 [marine sediment metagenome]|uniref:Uncharacterized protein n=1 Tax=marine sediment metagenome TaxID=412755 RepID=A0A0F8YH33_9ZZZZ